MSLEESAPPDGPERPKKSMSAARLAAQLLDAPDREYLEALKAAGLLAELDSEELLRIASEVEQPDQEKRRVDMLEIYYAAAGVQESSERRREADRFFLQRVGQPATAAGLVERLAALAPELTGVELERIGGDDGPLVMRCGEHFAAVLDHFEEELDTDQIDLRTLDEGTVPMVTIRGLVHALNVLLDRHSVRERLVSLRGDDDREVYVRLDVTSAIALANAGHLEDVDLEDVMDLAAW